eukprot:Trichotokara_eunicae@DN9618_c0_g1_i1.p1
MKEATTDVWLSNGTILTLVLGLKLLAYGFDFYITIRQAKKLHHAVKASKPNEEGVYPEDCIGEDLKQIATPKEFHETATYNLETMCFKLLRASSDIFIDFLCWGGGINQALWAYSKKKKEMIACI